MTIQPGQSVLDLVPDSCRRLPTCAAEEFLERKNVWLTSDPSLVLDTLPTTSPTGRDGSKEYHALTVVVLDGALRRTGEEFASTEFIHVRRGG
ncbi:hypothetical protein [Frankia sp. Mgl5]|uniref:hypothetical protein n=1 Tax=Frankia sp. Mgl5 TaxID=2933793 RepID=UPI00200C82FC|nr:hypothetical protein [Frankia sp. Mgl5]